MTPATMWGPSPNIEDGEPMEPDEMTDAELDAAEREQGCPHFTLYHSIPRLLALARRGLTSQWQKISSAPKDGAEVLLFAECPAWSPCMGVGFQDKNGWHWGWRFDPTHWMPLPPAPDATREENENSETPQQQGQPANQAGQDARSGAPTGEEAAPQVSPQEAVAPSLPSEAGEDDRLKPCPFCGGKVRWAAPTHPYCPDCGACFTFPICSVQSHALRLFNARTPSPSEPAGETLRSEPVPSGEGWFLVKNEGDRSLWQNESGVQEWFRLKPSPSEPAGENREVIKGEIGREFPNEPSPQPGDYGELVERLEAYTPEEYERTMRGWDQWRKAIADGCKASWPRDAFESHLDAWHQEAKEAAAAIKRLQAEKDEDVIGTLHHVEAFLKDVPGNSVVEKAMNAASRLAEKEKEIKRLRDALETVRDANGDPDWFRHVASAALRDTDGETAIRALQDKDGEHG